MLVFQLGSEARDQWHQLAGIEGWLMSSLRKRQVNANRRRGRIIHSRRFWNIGPSERMAGDAVVQNRVPTGYAQSHYVEFGRGPMLISPGNTEVQCVSNSYCFLMKYAGKVYSSWVTRTMGKLRLFMPNMSLYYISIRVLQNHLCPDCISPIRYWC